MLILADIFENFRDVCLNTYKLDPDWYFTVSSLSWVAMLKKTEINIDLLTDYDMILILEKGLKGGVTQCCNRYGKANNKYTKNYDKSKESLLFNESRREQPLWVRYVSVSTYGEFK